MVIKLMGGTVYQEINAMSRATATLLGNKVEWTLFRCVVSECIDLPKDY